MEGNFKNGQQNNGQQNQKGNNGVAPVSNNNSFGKSGAKWIAAGLGLASVAYVVYRVCKKYIGKKAEKKTEAPEAPATDK